MQIRCLGWKGPLEKGMAAHSSTAWREPIDRGAWRATAPGGADVDATEQVTHTHTSSVDTTEIK